MPGKSNSGSVARQQPGEREQDAAEDRGHRDRGEVHRRQRPPVGARPGEAEEEADQHQQRHEAHDDHRERGRRHDEVARGAVARLRALVHRVRARDPAQRQADEPQDHRAHERDRRRDPGEQPRAARRPVPQLGHEVAERHDHERQARVVVVLERRPVDARPADPLAQEGDEDQGEGEAAPPERLVRDERHRRDAHPPDHHVAGVVDRGRRRVRERALVEPDRLEVERPRPPRRARGMRRGQVVVVAVHLAGEGDERLPGVPVRPALDQLVAVDQRPWHVQGDVDAERDREQAHDHPHDRQPEAGAQPQPALGRLGGGRQHQAIGS